MKKVISILLVACMLSTSAYCADQPKAPEISAEMKAEMNKALQKEPEAKMTTGAWIWLGVIVVVGAVFGSIAVNSTSSTPR